MLGLVDQILHSRDEVPKDETLTEHRNRTTRESLLWLRGTKHLPADAKLIDVADQGSDAFEFLEHESGSGRRFVVRAHKVRKVYAGHEPVDPQRYLKKYVHSLPELGRFTMDVQAQRVRKARKEAEFVVRGGPVLVCPPHARSSHHGDEPLPLHLVQITEVNPPKGEKTIDWMLRSIRRRWLSIMWAYLLHKKNRTAEAIRFLTAATHIDPQLQAAGTLLSQINNQTTRVVEAGTSALDDGILPTPMTPPVVAAGERYPTTGALATAPIVRTIPAETAQVPVGHTPTLLPPVR